MIATFQPSSAERAADPLLSALGRNATPAPPSGPRFADLLRRGEATHGVLAKPAQAAPSAAAERSRQTPPDAAAEAPTLPTQPPASRALPPRAGAKPVTQHEKTAAATPTAAPVAAATATASAATTVGDSATDLTATAPGPAPGPTEGVPAMAAPLTALIDWRVGPQASDGAAAALDAEGTTAGPDRGEARKGGAPGARLALDPRADEARQPEPARASLTAASGATEWLAPAAAAATLRPPRTEARPIGDPLGAPLGATVSALPRGADPLAPTAITLATPVDSPAFAQALGAQVSVLARDGVQRAELHLNPAELGPISVQIEIVGQEARVAFGADMLTTRDIIENGLPELASALRAQGFTLAGGGVFQHAPESRQRPAGDATRGPRRSLTGDIAPTRTLLPHAPQGMLDLYA